jgi:hypothetical protein
MSAEEPTGRPTERRPAFAPQDPAEPGDITPAAGLPRDAGLADTVPGDAPPDDPQALAREIERTREELGETVEALAAKADVKARARGKAAELSGRLQGRARQVKEQVTARAGTVGDQVASKTAETTHTVLAGVEPVQRQVTNQAAKAGASLWEATPEPMQRAARRAAATARGRRVPLAVAAGAALLTGWLILRRRHR